MAKVKGATLLDSVKYLRRHKEAALRVLPPRLHHYLGERVLVGSWYPEQDLIPLVLAVARVAGQPEALFLEGAGRITARQQAEGIYAHLVDRADLASMPRKAHALWSSQHDTGTLECRLDAPKSAVFTLRDFALPSREMCTITGGYLAEVLTLIGLRDVVVRKDGCAAEGAGACVWIASFTPPQ